MKRVIMYLNGSTTNGKTLVIQETDTIQTILQKATFKFQLSLYRIFCKQGAEIDDINYIRDDDILYFSSGSDFEAIGSPGEQTKIGEFYKHYEMY